MVEVVWTEPALNDLDAIADYIALDNPAAARDLVQRIFKHVEQLANHPDSGSKPPELKGWAYRQIVEPACRIFSGGTSSCPSRNENRCRARRWQ